IEDGVAHLNLPVTTDMAGSLEIRAYRLLAETDAALASQSTTRVIVLPADDLKIAVTADRAEYRPGQEARLKLQVTDSRQRPVAAALNAVGVDESVFALSEEHPGLERVLLNIERELM